MHTLLTPLPFGRGWAQQLASKEQKIPEAVGVLPLQKAHVSVHPSPSPLAAALMKQAARTTEQRTEVRVHLKSQQGARLSL